MPAKGTTSESPGTDDGKLGSCEAGFGIRRFAFNIRHRHGVETTPRRRRPLRQLRQLRKCLWKCFLDVCFLDLPVDLERKKDMARRCTWNIEWKSSLETLEIVSCTWACQAQMKELLFVTSVHRDGAAMSKLSLVQCLNFSAISFAAAFLPNIEAYLVSLSAPVVSNRLEHTSLKLQVSNLSILIMTGGLKSWKIQWIAWTAQSFPKWTSALNQAVSYQITLKWWCFKMSMKQIQCVNTQKVRNWTLVLTNSVKPLRLPYHKHSAKIILVRSNRIPCLSYIRSKYHREKRIKSVNAILHRTGSWLYWALILAHNVFLFPPFCEVNLESEAKAAALHTPATCHQFVCDRWRSQGFERP